MRTKNEKVLLAVMFSIMFLGGNFYAYQWLAKKQSSMELAYLSLKADRADAELALQKQDLWTQRGAWIKAHQPELKNEGDAKAEVLQTVLKGARDNKLEILEQSLNDVQAGPGGTRVNVTVKIKGPMQGLCQWVSDLQKPESFYAVSMFSLKADQDQKSMVCTLRVARFFKAAQ